MSGTGERFHSGADCRSIRYPLSGQHSSAGSTMASSPISARSAPVPIHSSGVGYHHPHHHGPGTGLSSSAPGHNTILERPLPMNKPISSIASVTSSSSTVGGKEPISRSKPDHSSTSTTARAHHPSDSSSTATNERDHGTGTSV